MSKHQQLEDFEGTWRLDLKTSDSIRPMLELLDTRIILQKLADNMQVEQTIRIIDGNVFEVTNHASFGTSTMRHFLNAGEQVIEERGEKIRDLAIFDDTLLFPIVFKTKLAQNKGFTVDSRRVVFGEMRQILEFRLKEEDEPIVMKRYWSRVSEKATSIPKSKEGQEMPDRSIINSPLVKFDETKLPLVASPPKSNPVSVSKPSKAISSQETLSKSLSLRDETPTKQDWVYLVLVGGFFMSAWFRSNYLPSIGFLSLGLGIRFNKIFPPSIEEPWKLDGVVFCSYVVVIMYATVICLQPADDLKLQIVESFFAVVAFAWIRRQDIVQFDASTFLQSQSSESRLWMELFLLLFASTPICVNYCNDHIIYFPLTVGLYGLGRYRILKSLSSELKLPSKAQTPVSEAHHASVTTPSIQVTDSRVVNGRRSRPFAQYLCQVQLPGQQLHEVWVRYRDLRFCKSVIENTLYKNSSKLAPFFPPKKSGPTLPTVREDRQKLLNEYFTQVVKDFGIELFKLETVQETFQIKTDKDELLDALHLATKLLANAKMECERAAEVGEGEGWVLINTSENHNRHYEKKGPSSKYFKSIRLADSPSGKVLDNLLSSRTKWDLSCTATVLLANTRLEASETKNAFGGMSTYHNSGISLIRLIRNGENTWSTPHMAEVYQVALEDPRTGRKLLLETSSGIPSHTPQNGLEMDNIIANAFILDPISNDSKTLVTIIRMEDHALKNF